MSNSSLDERLYKKLKPLTENIARSISELNAKSFLQDLLMQAQLAKPDGKMTAHRLAQPKASLVYDIAFLDKKGYADITFDELKEKEPKKYYEIILSLWHIKEDKKIRRIIRF